MLMPVPTLAADDNFVVPPVGLKTDKELPAGDVIVIVAALLVVPRLIPLLFNSPSCGVVIVMLLLVITFCPLNITNPPAASAVTEIVPVVDPPIRFNVLEPELGIIPMNSEPDATKLIAPGAVEPD